MTPSRNLCHASSPCSTALTSIPVWGLKLPTLRQRLFRCVSIRENDDGTYAITAVQHVPEKEAIVDIENTPDGMQSQVLLAADRIAMVNPANGNTKPMFVGQGDQIFMNDVFLNPLRPVRKLLLIVLKRLPVQLRWKTQALQLKVL